jgi:hypothetical protein
MRFLRQRAAAVADRAACGGIIGAVHTLLSTMHAPAKSLLNLDDGSRRTLNDWGTLAYICAVSVPNETNKEQIAALAKQIKTNQRRVFMAMKTKHDLAHIDRCFDIDEPTNDTLNSTQQEPLEYGKHVDADRLAAASISISRATRP